MSSFYNPYRKTGLYNPASNQPYKISRSKLDLFLNCPRCFYLDRRLGISRPPGYPFSLNIAVDALLKKEFDIHRAQNTRHPLMGHYGISAVPFEHAKMNEWRNNLSGIQVFHKPTNFLVFGAIDDIWIAASKELHIVDYKATSKNGEINLDADWQISYKKQMEIYQWLARNNTDLRHHKISDAGYFVYCNGRTDKKAFDAKLEFEVHILPYKGNDSWVEQAIISAHQCLANNKLPLADSDCDFCQYWEAVANMRKAQF